MTQNILPHLTRRALLCLGSSALAVGVVTLGLPGRATAQAESVPAQAPFTFETLVERARAAAATEYAAPQALGPPFTDLDYDDYRNIQFRDNRARWAGVDAAAILQAYHPGWLFDSTVSLSEIVDGQARPLTFTAEDFNYFGDTATDIATDIAAGTQLPGVAGFRLNVPLNAPDRFDEAVSFLGASYFRALGAGNHYGLSARGLAVNTATSEAEEFPRFSAFWLERPVVGATMLTFYALLDSESVTGAYRFVLRPGETTTMDVTTELFFRRDVEQLGIAPLTSMYLFGSNDRVAFDDYRERVHDSEALIVNSGAVPLFRPLNNPPRLANSYFSAQSPKSFGLVQRHRDFEDFLDAGAQYERRPSLMVEPLGDWGNGAIRLIEIPSDLEANDNIVAFWVPEGDFVAGSALSIGYRLHWGSNPPGAVSQLAQVSRTLTGHGGVAGIAPRTDLRKFVIDFVGDTLMEPNPEFPVEARINVSGGEVVGEVLQRVDGEDRMWRLIIDVRGEGDAGVEMSASLIAGETQLTEAWIYQWLRE
ncbi:glucans biosynthesis protein [Loktanella fryxellensis]|uniref:Glucans biosynthesis protein G n=1 Tax=Loktanella fryxellensis TaxID=245187 RepID=A0A1H8A968_9RHOB|nr:glucan biosynthesis protein G [Loktanella fryxellensis]SEM66454.1 glucans biosynthesis protein [Loktanella fryxellensis]